MSGAASDHDEASAARIVKTRDGARMEQDGLILSEVLDHPGPTDMLFDILAACIAALAPGPRAAILGFAAGGVVAPLRAMGFGHPLHAVDLSVQGVPTFEALSMPWAGVVQVDQDDALRWLRRQRPPFDLVLEDLSADLGEGVTKPPVSLDTLPGAMASHLGPRGVAITNVLPVPGWSWKRLIPHLAAPFACASVLVLEEWENRVLIAGQTLPTTRVIGHTLRRHLAAIGSVEADGLEVRTVKRDA